MKRIVVFIFMAFCAASALSKPPGTVAPASMFDHSTTSTITTTSTTKSTTTTTSTTKSTATTTSTTKSTATTTSTTKSTPTTTSTTKSTPTTTSTTKSTPTTTSTTKSTPTTTSTTKSTPTTTSTTKTTPTTQPPPKPTPHTNLTVGNYTLMTDKKVICLMAHMALQIRLTTTKANETFIVQPDKTTTEGGCQETTANLTIVFKEGFINFMFNKSIADNMVYVDALSFRLTYPLSKGGNGDYTASNKSVRLFTTRIGHSYSCKHESLYMGNGLYLDVNQDRMQAFNLTKSNDFGSPDVCAADKPDYRVAIAVGVTLLVLIIIVVIAYLLGRRKRTDGYQSL
uniref:cell wall protein DAN4 isoform X2 n=1 Tax=Scatophagus argus TaxID=75038 RepID=UPI001ED82314|nr:cell wall protein DAN4 isoform X2 [Scatophagus argus]